MLECDVFVFDECGHGYCDGLTFCSSGCYFVEFGSELVLVFGVDECDFAVGSFLE